MSFFPGIIFKATIEHERIQGSAGNVKRSGKKLGERYLRLINDMDNCFSFVNPA